MNEKETLKIINEKYYLKIRNKYGKYIKNFDTIPDITKDIFFLKEKECVGDNEDLQIKRGKCVTKSGEIYLRFETSNENILIHEFIHRLSRNIKHKGFLRWGWQTGIDTVHKKVDYCGFNEIFTEWLAFQITGFNEELSLYQLLFPIINRIKDCLGNEFQEIIQGYFTGNYRKISKLVCDKVYFEQHINNVFNDISTLICLINKNSSHFELKRKLKHIAAVYF